MTIVIFVILHWYISLFCHSFFLHRYGAHKQFTMSFYWERIFFVLTWITQGISFLNPRSYAVMHRMHHAYSDTLKDPHSPLFFSNPLSMIFRTWKFYDRLLKYKIRPAEVFLKHFPQWTSFEVFAESWVSRFFWLSVYITIYAFFAHSPWLWLLLPINIFVSPIQGAIVNWSGHKYGYSNFDNKDHSKNSLPWDLLLLGELFQNNHHKLPMRANFAVKWWEVDPTWPVIKMLHWCRIIKLQPVEVSNRPGRF